MGEPRAAVAVTPEQDSFSLERRKTNGRIGTGVAQNLDRSGIDPDFDRYAGRYVGRLGDRPFWAPQTLPRHPGPFPRSDIPFQRLPQPCVLVQPDERRVDDLYRSLSLAGSPTK